MNECFQSGDFLTGYLEIWWGKVDQLSRSHLRLFPNEIYHLWLSIVDVASTTLRLRANPVHSGERSLYGNQSTGSIPKASF